MALLGSPTRTVFLDTPPTAPNALPVLSFFTGGGFLDLGFETVGFNIAWSNEYNVRFADLHDYAYTKWRQATNPQAKAAKISSTKSITHLHPRDIIEQAFGGRNSRPDIYGVIGGPPCTDFSVGGLQAGSAGFAGRLTGVYVKKLLDLNPAFFVLENVPSLVRHAKHKEYFDKKTKLLAAHYHLYERVLQAMEFGVPQDRERLFVVGIKKGIRANCKAIPFEWPAMPRFANAKSLDWPRENAFKADIAIPTGLPNELMVHHALGGDGGVEHLPNGKEWFTPYSKKFGRVPEGRVSTKSFKRLHRFRYSPTAWYGNNEVHLHPTKARRISVREALRLQSIPDSYVLPEEAPLCAKFKIICNGVPMKLAEKVAASVKSHLVKIGCIQ